MLNHLHVNGRFGLRDQQGFQRGLRAFVKPHVEHDANSGPRWMRPIKYVGHKFNSGFDWLSDKYGALTARLVRAGMIMLVIYAGLILMTGWRLTATPAGFIPQQDQGFLIGVVQLPPGASLERTDAVVRKASAIIMDTPGVQNVAAFAGLDGASFSSSSNGGVFFVKLDDWSKRGKDMSADAMAGQVMAGWVALRKPTSSSWRLPLSKAWATPAASR